MKGQAHVTPETVINLLSFIILTVVTVGTLLNVALYRLTYESRFENRQLIDAIENFLGSKCLVYQEDGEYVRGVLDESNLNSGRHCLILPQNVYFKVEGDGKVWQFGTRIPEANMKTKFVFPAVIAKRDGGEIKFIPARVEGRI